MRTLSRIPAEGKCVGAGDQPIDVLVQSSGEFAHLGARGVTEQHDTLKGHRRCGLIGAPPELAHDPRGDLPVRLHREVAAIGVIRRAVAQLVDGHGVVAGDRQRARHRVGRPVERKIPGPRAVREPMKEQDHRLIAAWARRGDWARRTSPGRADTRRPCARSHGVRTRALRTGRRRASRRALPASVASPSPRRDRGGSAHASNSSMKCRSDIGSVAARSAACSSWARPSAPPKVERYACASANFGSSWSAFWKDASAFALQPILGLVVALDEGTPRLGRRGGDRHHAKSRARVLRARVQRPSGGDDHRESNERWTHGALFRRRPAVRDRYHRLRPLRSPPAALFRHGPPGGCQ